MKSKKKRIAKRTIQNAPEVKTKNEVVDPKVVFASFGIEDMSQVNAETPKLLIMQGQSELVSEGKASVGQIIDPVTHKLFGDLTEGMPFLPVTVFEFWERYKVNGPNDTEFESTEKITKENGYRPYEEVDEFGQKYKNDRVFHVYLLPLQDTSFPRRMIFRKSSREAGKKLVTQMGLANPGKGLSPWGMVMKLQPKTKVNEAKKSKYIVSDIEPVSPATKEQEALAREWNMKLMAGQKNQAAYTRGEKIVDEVVV